VNPDPAESPIAAAVPDRRSSAWDIRNAPKNYVSLAAFQIAGALFSFATVWLVTRHIGSEGYGGVVAVIAASQVAQVFINWSSSAVVRFGVEEFIDTGAIARAFWMRFAIMAANLAVVLVTAQFWFGLLADWLNLTWASFQLVAVHFVVTVFWIHVQMSLQGAKLQRTQGLLQMAERAAILLGIVLLIFAGRLELVAVVIAYIAAPVVVTIFGLARLRNLIFSRFSFDGAFLRKVLLYSLPLLPFSLVGYFSGSYVDAIFIARFLSTRELGVYAVATQINGIAIQFPTLATALLVPFFVSLDKEAAHQKIVSYFANALPNLTLACGAIGTAAAAAGYFLIPVVFGVEFREAALPFWILITSTVMAIPVLCGYAPLTHARSVTYIAAIVAVAAAAVNIGLNFLLIPLYGMAGCAWATVLAYLASTVGFAVLLRLRTKVVVSWVFLAVFPNLLGTAVLWWTASVWMALAANLVLFAVVLTFRWRSVGAGIDIIKRLVRP
jgi:O-antigen/teichoic acid export membrane protein